MASEKSTVEALRREGWNIVPEREHALGSLQGKRLGPYGLVALLGPKNRFGAHYFALFLRDPHGDTGSQPVVLGLYHQGEYPSYNWVEIISLSPGARSGPEGVKSDISQNALLQQLFQYLADLLPPGGHMMVEYDSSVHHETAALLALRVPPVATPLGYMLFCAGCGTGIKDWYFAEGGREGPRKLQGFKALDAGHARQRRRETAQEIEAFADKVAPGASRPEKAALGTALAVLRRLDQ